ncbi:MAG TPA: ATP-binding protein, partial [Thermoanaerobaculia bacterium]|nr:ATP-binding protein [Thermoanaerobaculia bacterium]
EPVRIEADVVRLGQVLSNLLNNAAKYTERAGHIWLTAAREGDEVVLRVRDTGVGIAPDLLPRVFDLFMQADRSLDRSRGGLGIGLTLARRLVELHGGSVAAHSAGHGLGSELVVRLPILPPADAEAERHRNADARPARASAPCRILVVDDNVDSADSLALLLRLRGHEVEAVYDGHTALERAVSSQSDVIVLDIGLPGLDGYQVASELRKLPQTAKALLVALTGYGQEEDQRRAREAGFDHHLTKPVAPQVLYDLLDRLSTCIQA